MKKITIYLSALLLLIMSCTSVKKDNQSENSALTKDERMEWWREARFGMFIHWGLYAVPAGEWKGEQVPGISEWIMEHAEIPIKEYEALTKDFNPVKFNADEWVRMAKDAGMKYIVITSKHHDGFAMFKSLASKYNIVDATPFDRDPLAELATACKKHGVRLGFYYSQAQDWHEPGGTYADMRDGKPHWDKDLVREPLMNYIEGKAVPQVKELLTNYGDVDILWWDTPFEMTEEAAKELQQLVDQHPRMLTNNRLYEGWQGDFTTPEQHVPPTGLDYDWEVCMTMNTSWGYKKSDHDWKSATTLIQMLVDIASKGGNLLLNVGPTAEGLFPQESIDRLKIIGSWMKDNSVSVYGTTASPFFKLTWGRCTKKQDDAGTTMYFHVFNWPKNGEILVPGMNSIPGSVKILNTDDQLSFEKTAEGIVIRLPQEPQNPYCTVIEARVDGDLDIDSNMPVLKDGKVELTASFANVHNHVHGEKAFINDTDKDVIIDNWTYEGSFVEWMFNTDVPGKYMVEMIMSSDNDNELKVKIDEENIWTIPSTNGKFKTVQIGELEIVKAGDQLISFRPANSEWKGIKVKKVTLKKE